MSRGGGRPDPDERFVGLVQVALICDVSLDAICTRYTTVAFLLPPSAWSTGFYSSNAVVGSNFLPRHSEVVLVGAFDGGRRNGNEFNAGGWCTFALPPLGDGREKLRFLHSTVDRWIVGTLQTTTWVLRGSGQAHCRHGGCIVVECSTTLQTTLKDADSAPNLWKVPVCRPIKWWRGNGLADCVRQVRGPPSRSLATASYSSQFPSSTTICTSRLKS